MADFLTPLPGYVLKHATADELVAAGRAYITPHCKEVLQNLMSHPADDAKDGIGLTGRERDVLQTAG